MKKICTLVLTLATLISYSQEYWDYNIDFEDTSQFFRIEFDTIFSNNTWQIGSPQKSSFNSAYSPPNVIVTDTINPYPSNDTSVFYITHVTNDGFLWGGFYFPHTVIVSGYYKSDTDSLNDYGLLEFTPDKGETWIDLVNDTAYSQYLQWQTPKPVLTGTVHEWTYFYVNIADLGYVFNFQIGDTVIFKFTFISDSVFDSLDGLMFDNLHFEDWWESIEEKKYELINSFTFPNPATHEVTVEFNNPQFSKTELTVYNSLGIPVIILEDLKSDKTTLNLYNLRSGLYHYNLINKQDQKWSRGKFVVKK